MADTTWITNPDPEEMNTVRLWRAIVPPVVRRADRVVAISEAGKRDIVQHLRVPEGRIDIALPGPGSEPSVAPATDVRTRLGLGNGPLVLCVQGHKVHKNLMRLVRAMPTVVERYPDVRLILPGNPTEHGRELGTESRALGIADNVVFPGWVSDEDLEGLWAQASCSVVASLNEGFGLPVLESMTRGVPVASSNAGSLPEAGGDAAVYFDPLDQDAIAVSIIGLLSDPGDRVTAGRAWASTFTWERSADETLASFERAWAEHQR